MAVSQITAVVISDVEHQVVAPGKHLARLQIVLHSIQL